MKASRHFRDTQTLGASVWRIFSLIHSEVCGWDQRYGAHMEPGGRTCCPFTAGQNRLLDTSPSTMQHPDQHKCAKSIHDKGVRTTRQLANWKWSQAGKRQSGLFMLYWSPLQMRTHMNAHAKACFCGALFFFFFCSGYPSWCRVFSF